VPLPYNPYLSVGESPAQWLKSKCGNLVAKLTEKVTKPHQLRPGKSELVIKITYAARPAWPVQDAPTTGVLPDEGKHARHYAAGKKQQHPANRRPVEEEEKKPLFVYDPVTVQKRNWLRFIDLPSAVWGRSKVKEVDRDLFARLAREAAWCPRDPKMLRVLTNRAYQFLGDYDLQLYDAVVIHSIVMAAVGEAMRVTTEERDNVKLLRELAVNRDLHRHSAACKGELSFPLWPSRRIPKSGA